MKFTDIPYTKRIIRSCAHRSITASFAQCNNFLGPNLYLTAWRNTITYSTVFVKVLPKNYNYTEFFNRLPLTNNSY